ncbi:MAG: DNA gyrase subunit A, partial [Geminicoccales bacterium]
MTQAAPAIEPVRFTEALSQRYLAYALSTITARSLPDVRDGLKPVQRRVLYAMLKLRLDPDGAYKKCARVVGDVIGKFHPHGEVAIYDAMVRLAQEFAQRYPLVDGQGNFGNIDGDNAAAMRYTEARLTAVARALLDGIDQDTVDFRPTYDGSEDEPAVLPAAFPNLLANGTSGIAVGMATSIPPHNAGELCMALCRLLDEPETPVEALLDIVRGPDLPTGGVLVEPRASVMEAYRTGRGSFRLRARWQREDLGHGQYQVVVTEMPYQVPKARLIERIAELLAARKLPLLADVRDESAEEVRLVLVPRARTVPDELLMEQLFRQTELEVRLPLNLNVLDAEGVPRVMSLGQALSA